MSRKTSLTCRLEAETDKSIFLMVECFERIKVFKDDTPTGWMTFKKTYPIVYDKTEPVLFKRFTCRCTYCSTYGYDANTGTMRKWCSQVKCAALWMVEHKKLDSSVRELIENAESN